MQQRQQYITLRFQHYDIVEVKNLQGLLLQVLNLLHFLANAKTCLRFVSWHFSAPVMLNHTGQAVVSTRSLAGYQPGMPVEQIVRHLTESRPSSSLLRSSKLYAGGVVACVLGCPPPLRDFWSLLLLFFSVYFPYCLPPLRPFPRHITFDPHRP